MNSNAQAAALTHVQTTSEQVVAFGQVVLSLQEEQLQGIGPNKAFGTFGSGR